MPRSLAIEVRNVSKTFRIATHRAPTLRQRALHPFQGQGHRELQALDDVSLDVGRGEFMGIVGRNGSGKSTLLKLIASIYRADKGTIRVAGRLAPFIELGVGFNPEMTAYDNIVMNGVMMGLTRREARRRFDAVIEFAELEEFTELKLRNYSSGMRVRLAFAVMVQVDADVMLFDEVLAVGDAGFQQRSSETFFELRKRGKTIVLVTHSMSDVRTYCHRALLLESGRLEAAGDPEEVSTRYTELNFLRQKEEAHQRPLARVTDAWVEGSDGERTVAVQRREPLELWADLEVDEEINDPTFSFEIWTAAGSRMFVANSAALSERGRMRAGERRRVRATIENRLTPGHYRFNCAVAGYRPGDDDQLLTSEVRGVDLEITGEPVFGSLADFVHETRVEPAVRTKVAER